MTHKYADILDAFKQGEEIEINMEGNWVRIKEVSPTNPVWRAILNGTSSYELRVNPKVTFQKCVSVPVPETKPPRNQMRYYVPDPLRGDLFNEYTWIAGYTDMRYFSRGLIYLNKEDAIARAKAMLELEKE